LRTRLGQRPGSHDGRRPRLRAELGQGCPVIRPHVGIRKDPLDLLLEERAEPSLIGGRNARNGAGRYGAESGACPAGNAPSEALDIGDTHVAAQDLLDPGVRPASHRVLLLD
jgi:hypothetical protein